jgi:cytochrome c oxidase subunit 2
VTVARATLVLLLALAAGGPSLAQDGGTVAARGQAAFMANGCYGCHTIGGVGSPIASDLSRIGRRYPEADLARWLRDPAAQKPTAHMPRLTLSDADVAALAAYLATLGVRP